MDTMANSLQNVGTPMLPTTVRHCKDIVQEDRAVLLSASIFAETLSLSLSLSFPANDDGLPSLCTDW